MTVSPQLENGHLDLANELVEQFCYFRISGEEWQVLWVIWRKTYCWHKREDRISLSQFYQLTKMKKPSIIRALGKLEEKGIIISKDANRKGRIWLFNKHFDAWKSLAKELTSPLAKELTSPLAKELTSVSKRANESLAKELHTKETVKETIKEREKEVKEKEKKSPSGITPSGVRDSLSVSSEVLTLQPVELKKKDNRRSDVVALLEKLKKRIGVNDFFENSKIQYSLAKWLIEKQINVIGENEFWNRVEKVLEDNFHRKCSNRLKYFYGQIKAFIEPDSNITFWNQRYLECVPIYLEKEQRWETYDEWTARVGERMPGERKDVVDVYLALWFRGEESGIRCVTKSLRKEWQDRMREWGKGYWDIGWGSL